VLTELAAAVDGSAIVRASAAIVEIATPRRMVDINPRRLNIPKPRWLLHQQMMVLPQLPLIRAGRNEGLI